MKPFTTITVVIFAVICIMHLLRVILGWQVIIGGTTIPLWVSIVGALLAALMAVMVWKENK